MNPAFNELQSSFTFKMNSWLLATLSQIEKDNILLSSQNIANNTISLSKDCVLRFPSGRVGSDDREGGSTTTPLSYSQKY